MRYHCLAWLLQSCWDMNSCARCKPAAGRASQGRASLSAGFGQAQHALKLQLSAVCLKPRSFVEAACNVTPPSAPLYTLTAISR